MWTHLHEHAHVCNAAKHTCCAVAMDALSCCKEVFGSPVITFTQDHCPIPQQTSPWAKGAGWFLNGYLAVADKRSLLEYSEGPSFLAVTPTKAKGHRHS